LFFEANHITTHLKNVFASILYRDLITHYNIRNVNFLDRLVHFTADNIGSIIQVAWQLTDAATIEREFGNLNLIQDHYKKIVVSMDAPGGNTFNGIEHWSLRHFLKDFE
jgi:uncharacterized protein